MFELDKPRLTMTSREIADLVGSRPDSVKRTIERCAESGAITLPPTVGVSNPGPGPKTIDVYMLDKRSSLIVVAQLCPEFTARIVDRWQELENQASNPIANLTRVDLLKLALDSEEKRVKLEETLLIQAPKVEAFERISGADGSICITNAAKHLQYQPKRLFKHMQAHHWIYRRHGGSGYIGYQEKVQSGLLEHKVTTIERSDGSMKMVEQVLVTPKGLSKLAQQIGQH